MRDTQTLAFVKGKGWVPPEARNNAVLVEAWVELDHLVRTTKIAKERKRLEGERVKAHVLCAQECSVEIGKGGITEVDDRSRNARVTINADQLRDPIHGWLDMAEFTLSAELDRIRANFGRCRYRIIVRRRPDIDPTIPWDEVPEGDISDRTRIRDLVWLAPENAAVAAPAPVAQATNGQTPVDASVPAPVAAAVPAPSSVATMERPAPPAAGGRTCPLCGLALAGAPARKVAGGWAHKGTCPTDVEAQDAAGAPADSEAPTERAEAPAQRPGPRLEEARPWERLNSDGSVNLGSFALQASVSMVELAFEMLLARRVERGESGRPPREHVKAVAARLLDAADRAQRMVRPDRRFDRADNSHTRARGAVRAALVAYPFPAEGTPEQLQVARDRWVTDLAECAAEMIGLAVELDR